MSSGTKKIHRFFLQAQLAEGLFVIEDVGLRHQCSTVLRLERGERIALFDGSGHEWVGEILVCTRDQMHLQLAAPQRTPDVVWPRLTACVSLLRKESFEWLVEKLTEVGATDIVPLIAKRTVRLGYKKERLQKIAREAAEQCGRGTIPVIHAPLTVAEACSSVIPGRDPGPSVGDTLVFCNRTGAPWPTLKKHLPPNCAIRIFIGPEGGFDSSELTLAQEHGAHELTLGPLTLRTETAAVVAAYLVRTS